MGKVLGKHVISLYSTRISRVVKKRDVTKLQQDIENDPIIKDQMAKQGCLLVSSFDNFFCACFSCCAYSQQLAI